MAGRMINGATALAELVRSGNEVGEGGAQRALPVLPALGGLLPGRGLRRGSTVAIGAAPGGLVASPALETRRGFPVAEPGRGFPAAEPGRGLPAAESGRGLPAAEPGRGRRAGSGQPAAGHRGPALRTGGELQAPSAVGNTSLLLALLAAASEAGSWCAVVGVPELGAVAAAESGIALERLALVPNPGPEWPTVVGALIDGVDVVVLAVPGQVAPTVATRLVARARQRGCVLVPYGRWDGADVNLQVVRGEWEGLGEGHGQLRRRAVTVVARGRGAAARPKELTLWMPAAAPRPAIPPAPRPVISPAPRPVISPVISPAPRPVIAPASQEKLAPASVVRSGGELAGAPGTSPVGKVGTSPVGKVDAVSVGKVGAASGEAFEAAAAWESLRAKVRLASVDGETVEPA